jgi:hypothetical protein
MLSVFASAVLLVLATGGARVWAQTVVYPEDGFAALQSAVDAGGTVLLKARTRGGTPLAVKVPDNSHLFLGYYGNPVVLGGEVVGGSQSTVWGDTFAQKNVVWIKSGGVTIRNLAINAQWPRDGAIWMRGDGMDAGTHPGTGARIVIENNTLYSEQYGIGGQRTGGWPLVIRNNKVTVVCPKNASGDYQDIETIGIKLYNTGYWVTKTGSKTDPRTWTQASTPVEILNNDVSVTNPVANDYIADGIRVEGWTVSVSGYGLGPEWGKNGPVSIVGNHVVVAATLFKPSMPIAVARTWAGIHHCRVQSNVLEGTCNVGLFRSWYGGDNQIVGNDLTKVAALVPMDIGGHDTVVSDNIFGPQALPYGALILESVNADPANCPMPLPTANCTIMNNDYRQTGAPGWVAESGAWPLNGCILIDSEVDMWAWGTGVGTEVKNNLISETGRFPVGTGGPNNQVYEFNLSTPALCYNNRIVGLPANHIMNPGIGQRIKQARQARGALLLKGVQLPEE